MPDPCRVLVLNERDRLHPKAGGAEVHVAEIFRRLTERGYEVTQLACRFGDVPPRERLDGMDVHRIGRLPFYYPRVAFRCARETEAGHYDVVVECLNKVPFYSPVYSRVPVLALCHHLFGEVAFQQVAFPIAATVWMAERFVPWVYRGRPFLAISESSRDDLVARGIPASDVRVSHPGIDPSPLAIDPDKPRAHRIAYVGRLEPYKRIDLMLRAAALLRDRFPRMELVVIGRGAAQPSLERLASDLGLRERVTFTGFVSDEERDARLSECRLAVCASPKEGWGITVIECNRLGVPVVARDAPGLCESVRDGETGFLVERPTPEAFAGRMARLLRDDDLAQRMSKQALAWSKRFDWDDAADDMAGAIDETRRAG